MLITDNAYVPVSGLPDLHSYSSSDCYDQDFDRGIVGPAEI